MINSAKKELLLISPWFYQEDLMKLLIQKRKEGIIIKIIVRKYKDKRDNIEHLIAIQQLDQKGIQVVFVSNIHAKILIKDGNEALVSSKNIIDSTAIDMGTWFNILSEVEKARRAFYLLYNQRFFEC